MCAVVYCNVKLQAVMMLCLCLTISYSLMYWSVGYLGISSEYKSAAGEPQVTAFRVTSVSGELTKRINWNETANVNIDIQACVSIELIFETFETNISWNNKILFKSNSGIYKSFQLCKYFWLAWVFHLYNMLHLVCVAEISALRNCLNGAEAPGPCFACSGQQQQQRVIFLRLLLVL